MKPTNTRYRAGLTDRQKAALVQTARQAWEQSGQADRDRAASADADPFGMPEKDAVLFDAWRKAQQLELVKIDSLTKCNQRHYRPLMDHWLDMRAGKVRPKTTKPAPSTSPAPADWPTGDAPANLWSDDRGPQLRKIGKLLANGGLPWEYGHELADRMAGVARLDWCAPEDLRGIITALIKHLQKQGLPTTA